MSNIIEFEAKRGQVKQARFAELLKRAQFAEDLRDHNREVDQQIREDVKSGPSVENDILSLDLVQDIRSLREDLTRLAEDRAKIYMNAVVGVDNVDDIESRMIDYISLCNGLMRKIMVLHPRLLK